MNQTINKLKDGILVGVGIMLVFGITGLSYAALSWITQSEVTGGQTLTASSWNSMLNNQNYLKEQVESNLPKSGGTMVGEINMGTNKVTNLGAPIASTDAVTKAYADSVSASTYGNIVLCVTKNSYTGNLGGLSGANSKCASDCGTGFNFATYSELSHFTTIRLENRTRINVTHPNNIDRNCVSWTDGTTAEYSSVVNAIGDFTTSASGECRDSLPLVCIRY